MDIYSQIAANTPFTLFVIGIVCTIFVVLISFFVYINYKKKEERLPDAVKFEDLKEKNALLETDLKEKKYELENIEKEVRENKAILEEVEKAKEWLENNHLTIGELHTQIAKLREEYGELLEKNNKAKEELRNLKLEHERISLAKQSAQNIIEALNRDKDSIEERISELETKKDNLIKEKTEQEHKLSTLKDDIINYNNTLEGLRNEKAEIERNKKDLQEEIKRLKQHLAEYEEKVNTSRARVESIKTEIDNMEKIAGDYRNVMEKITDNLGAELEKLQPPPLERRLEDLYRPVIILPDNRRILDINEREWLREFQEHLDRHNFIFSERIIYAFHTSLKIADIAPLTVLAGISGTGKSLLPRLYAKAAGMNFLLIPVQPRWDSPDDLFGFYNYMEHRFKATELSRLMYQMDKYNNSSAREEFISETMTLVLLDEMNLARVEYYFSEFLSKLETRRGINPDNNEERKKAEIVIESGALQKNEQQPRIYPGENILFIGTMNEDETTQTLSDKVLDRANTLRFGKPQVHHNIFPDIEGFFNKYPTNQFIPFEKWQEWKDAEIDEEAEQILSDFFQRCNEILGNMGRPFGLRVEQAIKAYITQYPDINNNWFNDALADQIAQKILPKLNGIDQDDIQKDEIQNLIEEFTNDEALLNAFDSATEKPIFEWRGVIN